MAETIEPNITEVYDDTIIKYIDEEFKDSDEEDPGKTLKLVMNDKKGEVGSIVFNSRDKFPIYVIMQRKSRIPPTGHKIWTESKGWTEINFRYWEYLNVEQGETVPIRGIPESLL